MADMGCSEGIESMADMGCSEGIESMASSSGIGDSIAGAARQTLTNTSIRKEGFFMSIATKV